MDANELKEILHKHKMWLDNEEGGGEKANLRGVNLRRANLRDADLSWADLRDADLSGASGDFVTGYLGKHHAVAAGGYISIGCERHTYQEWLDGGLQIGRDNDYTDAEIADYVDWIRLAIRSLERMDRKD